MKGHILLLVLGATLLAQQCAARSVPRSIQLSDRADLFHYVLADYRPLIKGTLVKAKAYLERSQAEIADIAEPSQSLRELNTKITKLLANIDEVLEKPDGTGDESNRNFLQIMLCFVEAMIFPLEFIPEEKALGVLNRNGMADFFAEFKDDATNFLDKFDGAIKEYLDNLSETEKIKEQDMSEWYDEFHNSRLDPTNRFRKAGEFFQKFKPEGVFHLIKAKLKNVM